MGFIERLFGKTSDDGEVERKNLNIEKKDMIRGIEELSDTTVKEVMVARTDMVYVSIATSLDELLHTVTECGHSRIPVYEGTIDNVVGILYVKDLLRYMIQKEEEIKISSIIRKPYFVPESKKLHSLLREFKRRKVHMAMVVDEYGGTSGVVCLEDIIEMIVGDIQDEFDNETEEILKIGEDNYLCDARSSISDINEQLGINLPEDDFDTLGGYVFHLLGRIPVQYEKISAGNLNFIIQDISGHKINTVKIIKNRSKKSADA